LSRDRLVVFARAPVLGAVKTRLVPPLSNEQALALHRALVEDTLERLTRVGGNTLERWLCVSEPLTGQDALEIPPVWTLALQNGDDLGSRMESAFRDVLQEEPGRMLLLGSDSPTLPLEYVGQAFKALVDREVVLGPAEDGGYYLVGCSTFVPELFRGIDWGTDRVLSQSKEALSQANRKFTLLPAWYDVDSQEDLVRLRSELKSNVLPHIASALAEIP
jgi:rSAM/selenodomain-associated transferase 1